MAETRDEKIRSFANAKELFRYVKKNCENPIVIYYKDGKYIVVELEEILE